MPSLDNFYEKKGEKGVVALIFLTFWFVGALTGLFAPSMSLEQEFKGAGAAAVFLGRDWSAVMPNVDSLGGFLQGILYLPAMLICPGHILQYKLFSMISSAVYAVIPAAAFVLSGRMNIQKLWQRLMVSITVGVLPLTLVSSRFLLDEPLSAVFFWLLLLALFKKEDKQRGKARRFFASVYAAALTAGACFVNDACVVIFPAVCLLFLLRRIADKKTTLLFSVYTAAFVVICAAETGATLLIEQMGLYDFSGGTANAVVSGIASINAGGFTRWLTLVGGRLFYLTVSTWGISLSAIAVAAICVYKIILAHRKNKGRKKDEINSNDKCFMLLGVFCSSVLIFAVPFDALISCAPKISSQDVLFGSSGCVPVLAAMVFFFLAYIFKYGITYARLLICIIVLGFTCSGAMLLLRCDTLAELDALSGAVTPGLQVLLVGGDFSGGLNAGNALYPICLMFTAYALMTVVVCCTKRYGSAIVASISLVVVAVTAIASVGLSLFGFTLTGYDSSEISDRIKQTVEAYSPNETGRQICVYKGGKTTAMNLQFCSQGDRISYADTEAALPENGYIVSEASVKTNGLCLLIGRIDSVNIYATGENAVRRRFENTPEAPPSESN